MAEKPIKVLLVEDNRGDAELVRVSLQEVRETQFEVAHVERLDAALQHVRGAATDVILLDLSLPDSFGLETVAKMNQHAPHVPIVVLTGLDDERVGLMAVLKGAQDYLVKGQVDGKLLARVMRYATERKRAEERMKEAFAELKLAHEELKAAQQRLVEAEKMQTVARLAAGVAHEVKNPLAVLHMGIDYLAQQPSLAEKESASILQEMTEAIEEADTVIDSLLSFSAGSESHWQEEDLNALVEQSLGLVRSNLTDAGLAVANEFGQTLPLVKLDRKKIEQVLVSIFMNAIQAMPRGGSLVVRTFAKPLDAAEAGVTTGDRTGRRWRAGDTVVVVQVDDTGPGIPEDKLAKVFDPFFSTRPVGEGTGLGLTVAKAIVELHGGRLSLHNRPEGGLRVTVMLKARAVRPTAEQGSQKGTA